MKQMIDKNTVLSGLLGLFTVLIVLRATPAHVAPIVKLEIVKNRETITSIHQSRDVESTKQIMVERLDLWHDNKLSHPELGQIGYADNFFVDIRESFTVKEGGRYRFNIGTDDGFSAAIDGEQLCEFPGDRPYTQQSCVVNLDKGRHTLVLSYFQGYGNSGLTVQYMSAADDKLHYFGDDSRYFDFD